MLYNLYRNGVRLDDPIGQMTAHSLLIPNAIMRSITGDVQTTFMLDELGIPQC